MAQILVNFRLEEEDKKGMEEVCHNLGMSMSTAFTIYAKKIRREKRIPFEVSIDPFYDEENIETLKEMVEEIRSGRTVLVKRECVDG